MNTKVQQTRSLKSIYNVVKNVIFLGLDSVEDVAIIVNDASGTARVMSTEFHTRNLAEQAEATRLALEAIEQAKQA